MKHYEQHLAAVFQRALLLAAAACGTSRNDQVDSSALGDATVQPDGPITDASEDTPEGGGACAKVPYTPMVMDLCAEWYRLPCSLPEDASRGNCFFTYEACTTVCEGFFYNCLAIDDSCNDGSVVWGTDGGLKLECSWCVGGPGRAPAGLAPERFSRTVAGWFARAAFFEAASVGAFRTLRRELRALGAPASLVRAARNAEGDERRHAREMKKLARRFGSHIPRPRTSVASHRSLEAIAIENAIEGCIGETYAALEALHQAEHAPENLRATFCVIARDELRHAALAWAVAGWIEPQLSDAARARLSDEKRVAVRRLERMELDGAVARRLGLPDAKARRLLVRELEQRLWS